MATATSHSRTDDPAASEPSTPTAPQARPQHTVRMSLTINATTYQVEPIPVDPGAARQCFQLRKPNGEVHHVSTHDFGGVCTCGDYEFNRNHRDPLGCKHIRAMVAMGVLDTRAARVQPRQGPPADELGFDDEFESAAAKNWPDWTDTVRYGIRRR